MKLFAKKYTVNFKNGKQVDLTAKKLLKLVRMANEYSNYCWFASTDELVRICKLPDFPQDIAQLIEAAILKCFSNIQNSAFRYPDDVSNVVFCYNSLIGKIEYDDLRKKYICSILQSVIDYGLEDKHRFLHFGDTYKNMCQEWKNLMADDFVLKCKKIINLKKLFEIYNEDFEIMIQDAESKGLFDKDEHDLFKETEKSFSFCLKIF